MNRLFEEYVESFDYKIMAFLKELKYQIIRWFGSGSFAAQGCELDGDIQLSNYNPMEKFLMFSFVESDDNESEGILKYRISFTVRIDKMSDGDSTEINKILLKIYQFGDEIGELVEEIDITDIKEDFIIDRISQLKNKSDDDNGDDDLENNLYIQ